jgi:peptidylprolyl isomerase/peptidyl-prolyl cis-trans isomerase B (cyclophilin B)
VLPGFVAQAGDPTGTGSGGPGYDLPFESTSQPVEAGSLAVAKPSEAGAPNNGSQFFLALDRLPTQDGRATVFGKVIEGLDVATKFAARDPLKDQDPAPGTRIQSITIEES